MSDNSHHHITPMSTNITVFLALLALTVITVAASSFVDFGSAAMNLTMAMLIALIKAITVALFFMQLAYGGKVNRAIFIGSFLFLALFFSLSAADIFNRSY